MRLAHYSDIHVTIPPLSGGVSGLLGKRITGTMNYYFGGRRTHFAGAEGRIRSLLEDIDAQGVDHALCTGDVTQMSRKEEFARCAAIFGDRLQQPDKYTVIPGNHDRYTVAADRERRFERYFGTLAAEQYPFVKRIGPLAIVGLDVARAAGLLDSSGLVGDAQLDRLAKIVREEVRPEEFVVLAMHYGLYRKHGQPDRPRHGIRDFERIVSLVKDDDTHVDMVVHGHMHEAYRIDVLGVPEFCSGSATDLYGACGYSIYEIDVAKKSVEMSRRVWDVTRSAYVARE